MHLQLESNIIPAYLFVFTQSGPTADING